MDQFWHVKMNTGQIAREEFYPTQTSKDLLPALCRQSGYVRLPGSLSDFTMHIYAGNSAGGFFEIFRETNEGRVRHSKCAYCTDSYFDNMIFQTFVIDYRNALEAGEIEPQQSILRKPPTPWLAVLRWKGTDPKITAPFERAVFDALVSGARDPVHTIQA